MIFKDQDHEQQSTHRKGNKDSKQANRKDIEEKILITTPLEMRSLQCLQLLSHFFYYSPSSKVGIATKKLVSNIGKAYFWKFREYIS